MSESRSSSKHKSHNGVAVNGSGANLAAQQQQMLLALAAQSQMAASYGQGMYNPFMNMNNMFSQNMPQGWGAQDYMAMATWQQMAAAQQQQANNETFADALKKLGAAVCSATTSTTCSNTTSTCTSTAKQTGACTTSTSAGADSHSVNGHKDRAGSKLDTLAAIAEQLSRDALKKKQSAQLQSKSVTPIKAPTSSAQISNGNGDSRKRPAPSAHDASKTTKQHCTNQTGNQASRASSSVNGKTTVTNPAMSSQLLEASARAWMALSSQLVMGQLPEEFRQQLAAAQNATLGSAEPNNKAHRQPSTSHNASAPKSNGHSHGRVSNGSARKCISPRAASENRKHPSSSRGRPATISSDAPCLVPSVTDESVDSSNERSLQDAIESVVRQAASSDEPLDAADCPLDLTVKSASVCDSIILPEQLSETSADDRSVDTPARNKKPTIDEDLVRLPLQRSWRRQTCIRALGAGGVRGDVIYYAPCGKRLGSYAEVLRYLKKGNPDNFQREYFSFSSKLVVGEFIQTKNGVDQNTLIRLDEVDVQRAIDELCSKRANGRDVNRTEKYTAATVNQVMEAMVHAHKMMPTWTANGIIPGPIPPLSTQPVPKLDGPSPNEPSTVASDTELLKPKVELTVAGANDELAQNTDPLPINNIPITLPPKRHSRGPRDDLELDELKPFPIINRVPGLRLSDQAFADLLMINQFIHTFGAVLRIDLKEMPSVDMVHSGLMGQAQSVRHVRKVCKVLLTLVLEYPGLPSGARGRTLLGQSVKDVGVKKHNYTELLRLWLASRDEEGRKLSQLLEQHCFEALTADDQLSMLAFMCNELLYCRNVVREIEGNIDEVARIKGEKWVADGKLRMIRTLQTKKRRAALRAAACKATIKIETLDSDNKVECGESVKIEGTDQAMDATPTIQTDAEPVVKAECTPVIDDCTDDLSLPAMPLGITYSAEVVSAEERAMNVEELQEVGDKLEVSLGEMRDKLQSTSQKVRVQAYGQDRYERLYWQLSSVPALLVEGSRQQQEHLPNGDAIDGDVVACVRRLVQQTDESVPAPRVPVTEQYGWWCVRTQTELHSVKEALLSRGIRERMLHRTLNRADQQLQEIWPNQNSLEFGACDESNRLDEAAINLSAIRLIADLVDELEEKVLHANVHSASWHKTIADGSSEEQSHNKLNVPDTSKPQIRSFDQILNNLKERLMSIECNIEPRYVRASFNNECTSVSDSVPAGEEATTSTNSNRPSMHAECHESVTQANSSVSADLLTWRQAVHEANTPSLLMLCLQKLDANIAWERSVMRAFCQICRTGDNESLLLLCDYCDMAYHTYCFTPKMPNIPSGDWFCPKCVTASSGEPCCIMCRKQTECKSMISCTECHHYYHSTCSVLPGPYTPKDALQQPPWTCHSCTQSNNLNTQKDTNGEQSTSKNNKSLKRANSSGSATVLIKKQKVRAKVDVVSTPTSLDLQELCSIILAELDGHKDSWPFRQPVDMKSCPLYKKVIQKPIDLSVIQRNLQQNKYEHEQQFVADIKLIFTNCKVFNEDDSQIGKAGRTVRRFFNRRWKELKAGVRVTRVHHSHTTDDHTADVVASVANGQL